MSGDKATNVSMPPPSFWASRTRIRLLSLTPKSPKGYFKYFTFTTTAAAATAAAMVERDSTCDRVGCGVDSLDTSSWAFSKFAHRVHL